MTDEEKIEAVSAALTGDPYCVGRRIRHVKTTRVGEITHVTRQGEFVIWVYVRWANGDTACLYPGEAKPL